MKEWFPVNFKDLFNGLFFSILGTMLILCLIFIAYSLVFNAVTSRPEKIKAILDKSSLYENLPSVIYDQAAGEREGSLLEVPLNDPEIRRIALDSYDQTFVQDSMENLIDGLYGWLDGTTEEPQISISFSGPSQEFAAKLAKYVEKKVSKLPLCDPGERADLNEVNIFSTKCRPADISPKEAGQEAKKVISGADDSVLNTSLNAEDLKTSDGQPLHENFADLPESFSTAKSVLPALIVFALVLITIIFYFSKDKIAALRRISKTLLLAGIMIAALPVIFLFTARYVIKNIPDNDQLANIVRTLFEEFMAEASKIYYPMGIILIAAAAGIYVYIRKNHKATDKLPKTKS